MSTNKQKPDGRPKFPFNTAVTMADVDPISSPKHLAFIRTLPCVLSGRYGVDYHHLLRGPKRGMGMKSGDQFTIPLYRTHHDALHHCDGDEKRYLARYGLHNAPALALALHKATGDGVAAIEIMAQHKRDNV